MLPTMLFFDQLWNILFLWNTKAIYVLLFFHPEQIMESLFLERDVRIVAAGHFGGSGT